MVYSKLIFTSCSLLSSSYQNNFTMLCMDMKYSLKTTNNHLILLNIHHYSILI